MQPQAPLADIFYLNEERALVGYFLTWMFYGVLCVQTYLYFTAFPKDRLSIKLTVAALYIMDSAQTFVLMTEVFSTIIYGFGNLLSLDEVSASWFSIPIMSGLIASLVQGVYVYRIYVLSESKLICGVISFLSLLQLGGAFVLGLQAKRAQYLTSILTSKPSLITAGIWEGSSALCDIIIAFCMIHYLRIRGTGVKRTQDLVNRIIRMSIGTGAVTATLALITLILAYLPGQQLYWLTTVMILGKAYSNSIMVVLNSRFKVVSNGPRPAWNEKMGTLPKHSIGKVTTLRFAMRSEEFRPISVVINGDEVDEEIVQ